jgi:hypothetical protein
MKIRRLPHEDVGFLFSTGVLLFALSILGWQSYAAGTILWVTCGVALVAGWPRPDASTPALSTHRLFSAILGVGVAGACAWALVSAAVRALPVVFAGPPDVYRGDMLVVINLAVDRFLAGENPYRLYHVPWEVPLPYGPMLWMPYIVPRLLNFDVRVFTLAGQLAIPAACGLAALIEVGRMRLVRAASLVALLVALAWQPQFLAFSGYLHTQMYWPLLLVFAILVVEERWTGCCIALGLLVAARTTMVTLVPVFILTLLARGALTWQRMALLAVSAIGPFLPFFVNDPQNVIYGMYGSYQKVMKGFVWRQTTWVLTTFGVTGPLLARGAERYVEIVQVCALLAVYGAAWVGLRARHSPLPWMVLSLLAFSMTTLWPVLYLYFDVWVLAACGLVVATWSSKGPAPLRAALSPAVVSVVALALVLVGGARVRGAAYSIDVGTPKSTGMTGGGFGADTSVTEGDRTFVWVEGPLARVRVPRAGFFRSRIRVALRPFSPVPGLHQTVTATLNGRPVGMATLREGWQDVTFEVRRSAWLYGFNVLDLRFAYAVSEASVGAGSNTIERAAAIDRITIE